MNCLSRVRVWKCISLYQNIWMYSPGITIDCTYKNIHEVPPLLHSRYLCTDNWYFKPLHFDRQKQKSVWPFHLWFSLSRWVRSLSEWPSCGMKCGMRVWKRLHAFTLVSATSRACLLCWSLCMPWWSGDLRHSKRPLLTRYMSSQIGLNYRV